MNPITIFQPFQRTEKHHQMNFSKNFVIDTRNLIIHLDFSLMFKKKSSLHLVYKNIPCVFQSPAEKALEIVNGLVS